MFSVTYAKAFRDNYIWLVHGQDERDVAIVDPGDAAPVMAAVAEQRLRPAAILVTHHHPDHVGGVARLAREFDLPVHGPAREADEVVTHPLREGEMLELSSLGLVFQVLEIPGHTLGHIAFHGHAMLFCGDTLFSGGCGRLFEGTPEQMAASLERLASLPDETRVYCGHEYTAANLAFAALVEPNNAALRAYRDDVAALEARGAPTLPSRIGLERAINPFLRTSETSVRLAAEEWSGSPLDDKVRVFAALRRWKDQL